MGSNKFLKAKTRSEIIQDFCKIHRISDDEFKKFIQAMKDTSNRFIPLLWEIPLMIIALSLGIAFIHDLTTGSGKNLLLFTEGINFLKRSANIMYVLFILSFIACGIIFPLVKIAKRHDW